MNIYMDGVLIILSVDNNQIQPIEDHPFVTSCHIMSCFKIVTLEKFVQASNDDIFKRISC